MPPRDAIVLRRRRRDQEGDSNKLTTEMFAERVSRLEEEVKSTSSRQLSVASDVARLEATVEARALAAVATPMQRATEKMAKLTERVEVVENMGEQLIERMDSSRAQLRDELIERMDSSREQMRSDVREVSKDWQAKLVAAEAKAQEMGQLFCVPTSDGRTTRRKCCVSTSRACAATP